MGGPREVVYPEVRRVKAKVTSDGIIGWMTLKDRNEVEYAKATSKLHTIKTTVAMTNGPNIKDKECQVLRKLAEGELFEMEGDAILDDTGVTRMQGVAMKDGLKGWVTSKGNAGTVYAELTDKYYTISKAVELQKEFKSVGVKNEVVRKLEIGEALQIIEGP